MPGESQGAAAGATRNSPTPSGRSSALGRRRFVPTQARFGRGNGVALLGLPGNCVWTEFEGGAGDPLGARSPARRGRSDGRGLGQLPDESRRIGTGRQLGCELLDLALRAVGGPLQDGLPVVGGQVRGELGDGGEVEPPVGEHGEEDRVLARRPGGGDAQVGFGLGEVEPLGAVGEHGRRGLAGVEPACVDFADVGDEVGFAASRLAQDVGEAEEELAVGELLEGARGFHTHNIGSDFSRAGDRACGAPRRGMRFEASEANARLLARRWTRGARSAGVCGPARTRSRKLSRGKCGPVLNSPRQSPAFADGT